MAQKKLGTMMLCMAHVISFYYGKSHINGPKKDRYHDAVNDTCDNTSLVKCLQTFATELNAIMCLMSKTEQFEFRAIKCHIETLFKSFCV